MTLEISTQIRIQEHEEYWYTVEDTHIDVGFTGCTISGWGHYEGKGDKRDNYVCMEKDEALAIADAIYKLFKGN
jgi:hypothetical protein